jgi:hypothetical protein
LGHPILLHLSKNAFLKELSKWNIRKNRKNIHFDFCFWPITIQNGFTSKQQTLPRMKIICVDFDKDDNLFDEEKTDTLYVKRSEVASLAEKGNKIFYIKGQSGNQYSLMQYLEFYDFETSMFFGEDEKEEVFEVVKKSQFVPPYNIYSGNKIENASQYRKGDLREVHKQLLCGVEMAERYYGAVPFEDWMYNSETPILKGVISYYGCRLKVDDLYPEFLMRESQGFRDKVFDILSRIIMNYAYNNEILEDTDVKEILIAKEKGKGGSDRMYSTLKKIRTVLERR